MGLTNTESNQKYLKNQKKSSGSSSQNIITGGGTTTSNPEEISRLTKICKDYLPPKQQRSTYNHDNHKRNEFVGKSIEDHHNF